MNIPYLPTAGYLGDPIPFFWKGQYHLFYLRGLDSGVISGIARWVGSGWNHLVSDDLVNWRELPPAFGPGPAGSQDFFCCATGSIVEREGTFHAFYPGFNLEREPRTAICHAYSGDLIHWDKDPANPIATADPNQYGGGLGDTFVFWNEEAGAYWMLVTTQTKEGPQGYRSCLGLLTSSDLECWQSHPPFWAPSLPLLEVSNLFPLDERWYLTFNMWTGGRMAAMYRSAETLSGPWCAPGDGQLDSAHWYAGNTLSDGRRRLAFGWIPTLEGERPGGMWQWGGHLGTPRELWPGPDGALHVRCPDEVLAQFAGGKVGGTALRAEAGLGSWTLTPEKAECAVPDRVGIAWLPPTPDPCLLEARLTFAEGTQRIGFLLRTQPDLSAGYVLRLEPELSRVVLDYWPRPDHEAPALTRALELAADRPVNCRLLLSGSVLETFIDDRVALSARLYAPPELPSALLIQDGVGCFEHLAQRPQLPVS